MRSSRGGRQVKGTKGAIDGDAVLCHCREKEQNGSVVSVGSRTGDKHQAGLRC